MPLAPLVQPFVENNERTTNEVHELSSKLSCLQCIIADDSGDENTRKVHLIIAFFKAIFEDDDVVRVINVESLAQNTEKVSLKDFELLRVLGQGSFGKVNFSSRDF